MKDLEEEITVALKGLLYPSETDEPMHVVPCEISNGNEVLRVLAADYELGENAEKFAKLKTLLERHFRTIQFVKLGKINTLLERHFRTIQFVKLGKINIDCYFLCYGKNGLTVAIKTKAVET